jgi:hypothetical protein
MSETTKLRERGIAEKLDTNSTGRSESKNATAAA